MNAAKTEDNFSTNAQGGYVLYDRQANFLFLASKTK